MSILIGITIFILTMLIISLIAFRFLRRTESHVVQSLTPRARLARNSKGRLAPSGYYFDEKDHLFSDTGEIVDDIHLLLELFGNHWYDNVAIADNSSYSVPNSSTLTASDEPTVSNEPRVIESWHNNESDYDSGSSGSNDDSGGSSYDSDYD